MKIAVVGSMPPPVGGTTVSLQVLVEFLRGRGDDVTVVDCSARGTSRIRTLLRALRSVWRAAPAMDVVSLHLSDGAAVKVGWLFWLAVRLRRKPLVYRQFGGEFARTHRSLSGPVRWLVERSILSADVVLLQTREQMAYFMPICRGYVVFFPTARPRRTAGARGARAAGDALSCVYVGHVRRSKGLLTAADAMRGLERVTFDIYGPRIDVEEEELRAPNVAYRGVLEPDEVAATLRRYDVFLFPTNHPGEGYSGAVIEAIHAGLPLVVCRWSAAEEMLGDAAVYCEPEDPTAIRHALAELRDDPPRLADLAARSEGLSPTYDSDAVFETFRLACRRLVAAGRAVA